MNYEHLWEDNNFNSEKDFHKELCWIAKTLGIRRGRIKVDPVHPVGEVVIFIDGSYNGYIDQRFYDFMEQGIDPYDDFKEWIEMWRNKV